MAAYFEQGSPGMAQLTAIVDRLEQMVDHAGLANLFYALEHVCSAKARTNPSSAWHWMSLANTMAQGCECGEHGRDAAQAHLFHRQVAQTRALK